MKQRFIVCLLLALFSQPLSSLAQSNRNRPEQKLMSFAANAGIEVKTKRLSSGVQLQYAEKGKASGVPVIFLHGITDSWHSFESVLALLPESIHAFAITQRGHGDSERPARGYKTKDFAADVAAFIRDNKLGPSIIVGHSMGGINTLQFAVDYPGLVKSIVIIDSDPDFSDNTGLPEFQQEVAKIGDVISYQFMDDFQKATLSKPIDSSYYNLLVAEGLKTPGWVFKQAIDGFMELKLASEIHKIQVPALLLWGSKDSFVSRKDQEFMRSAIKQSKLIVYEGTGHALHWEEPKRFVDDLVDFILNTGNNPTSRIRL
jgi:non-heme chloroperoxidase